MTNTAAYAPDVHCLFCIQSFTLTAAAVTVEKQGRTYQACTQHAPLLERSPSLADAIRSLKQQRKQGNPA